MSGEADALTLLKAKGHRLAKLHKADGTEVAYDDPFKFDMCEVQAHDLDQLACLLRALQSRTDVCVARAMPLPSFDGPRRRLLYADRDTGDAATLADVQRSWLLLDIDDVGFPPNHEPADTFSCAIACILRLPQPFHGARCVAVPTGGHGIKPTIRMRLGFMLSRPLTCVQAKLWLRDTPVDRQALIANQPIYTAAPQFEPGRVDPLPSREPVCLPGPPCVRVPDQIATPRRDRTGEPFRWQSRLDRHEHASIRRIIEKVATAREGERNKLVFWGACRLRDKTEQGVISRSEAERLLLAAAEHNGLERRCAEVTVVSAFRVVRP